ncbi:hypothetical protein BD626DRAFT_192359 [Schizophyllum amplum]|uniref:Uncharacterized protein n=1 Tax=Schizophyllum amplum TaxID=97359 RepID=A0A550CM22_9AGAR|nr:hypothetical protein BD626DRAFT_192359 [Auriculariopsis ampla]
MPSAQRNERTPLLAPSSNKRTPRSRRPSNASTAPSSSGTRSGDARPRRENVPPRPRPVSIAAVLESQESSQAGFLDYVRNRFDLDSETPAVRASLTLLLLLQYRRSLKDTLAKGRNDVIGSSATVRQAQTDLVSVDEQDIPAVLKTLEDDIAREEELWDVLWISWLREDGRDGRLRVVDFLYADDAAPEVLLKHRLVAHTLERHWIHGAPSRHGASHTVWQRFDALCTPRLNLLSHNVSLWIYFALLASYLIHPPRRHRILPDSPLQTYGARECFLLLFSLGVGLNRGPWSALHALSGIMTLVTFSTTLPDVPYPTQDTFSPLLVSFTLTFVAFHIPNSPASPFLLLTRTSRAWPLALFLWDNIVQVLFPAIAVLLPSFLLISFLLTAALNTTPYEGPDTVLFETISNVIGIFNDTTFTTPMETRETLFMLLLAVIACMAGVVFLACTRAPSTVADLSIEPWERYGPLVGARMRQLFAQAVVTYSMASSMEGTITGTRIKTGFGRPLYMFPPPLNLVHLLLVVGPRTAGRLFARGPRSPLRGEGENRFIGVVGSTEAVLWRILVGPLALTLWALSWVITRAVK